MLKCREREIKILKFRIQPALVKSETSINNSVILDAISY